MRSLPKIFILVASSIVLAGCGGDESDKTASTTTAAGPAVDLSAVKSYLLDHTVRLKRDTGELQKTAAAYDELAARGRSRNARMLSEARPEVARLVRSLQDGFAKANPAYEEMEGVVAGVPSLADFDVIIDAGADKSDPENAVPFDLKTPAGKTFKQPGNFNYLIETSAFGTEPKFAAKGVEPTSTATARSSSARPSRTRTSTSRPPAASRSTRRSSTPRRATGSPRRATP